MTTAIASSVEFFTFSILNDLGSWNAGFPLQSLVTDLSAQYFYFIHKKWSFCVKSYDLGGQLADIFCDMIWAPKVRPRGLNLHQLVTFSRTLTSNKPVYLDSQSKPLKAPYIHICKNLLTQNQHCRSIEKKNAFSFKIKALDLVRIEINNFESQFINAHFHMHPHNCIYTCVCSIITAPQTPIKVKRSSVHTFALYSLTKCSSFARSKRWHVYHADGHLRISFVHLFSHPFKMSVSM